VQQLQSFPRPATNRRSAVARHVDLGWIHLVQEVSPFDHGCSRILRASSEVVQLALSGAAGQRNDDLHYLVVINRSGELRPEDASLLNGVVQQCRHDDAVAMVGDGYRHPTGMLDMRASQSGQTTSEDPLGEIVGGGGRDHHTKTERSAQHAAGSTGSGAEPVGADRE
jgi:hypothetical protein